MTIDWPTAWRLARRELSARFKGLRLLVVCLFLGTAALAAIGSLTGAIESELASRGREMLGGDIEAAVWQRPPSAEEIVAYRRLGTVSTGLRMQAMASRGDLAVPVELKAVDAHWPLVGTLELSDGRKVGAPTEGEVWLGDGAAQRLNAKAGDTVHLAGTELKVGGIIRTEPDRLSEGFALGPVVIVRDTMPKVAGLTAPGAMYRSKTRIALPAGTDAKAAVEQLQQQFPDAGTAFRTRDNAAPGAERFVSRMGEFLVLVGLAALVIAGIGIGGGVASYLEARRASIATLKVLGAASGDIARIYLIQIAAAALLASVAGLAVGVAVTPLLARALGDLLPIHSGLYVDPLALARAAGFGLVVALIFAAPPLIRAKRFPAMALLRARVAPLAANLRDFILPLGGGLVALVVLALAGASNWKMTMGFLGGAAAVLGLLALLGLAIRWLTAKAPRPRNPLLRTALANIHRPGTQTGALVTALGFGLSAFVMLAATQTSLDANIARRVPARAPDYFVLDVPRDQADAFRAAVLADAPQARIRMVPALRGRILAYGPAEAMTRVSQEEGAEDVPWQLRGERGLTYADDVPEGNTVTAGQWWPHGYSGEPLVSVDEDLAKAIGLTVGDRLTIGLLGVERTARVASLRRIDWDSMGFNYVLVFSPNSLRDAPHNLAATIDLPNRITDKGALLRALVRGYPSSSVIEVGGLLRDARTLLSQMSAAILAAASVAVLAGLAVLLGAIAAARASRTYDNVILRVLGASRRQMLTLQIAEYGLLAALLAGVALALGSLVAWIVIVQLFEFDWLPNWPRVLAVLGGGVALVLTFALGGSLPLLRAKPAEALREL